MVVLFSEKKLVHFLFVRYFKIDSIACKYSCHNSCTTYNLPYLTSTSFRAKIQEITICSVERQKKTIENKNETGCIVGRISSLRFYTHAHTSETVIVPSRNRKQ